MEILSSTKACNWTQFQSSLQIQTEEHFSDLPKGDRETHSECAWKSNHGRRTARAAATIRVRAASQVEHSIIRAKRRRIGPETAATPNHRFRTSSHCHRQRVHHSRTLSVLLLSPIRFHRSQFSFSMDSVTDNW